MIDHIVKSRLGVLGCIAAVCCCGAARADYITLDQAKLAVRAFVGDSARLHGSTMGTSVKTGSSRSDAGGRVQYHVVSLEGGGFVITSADDRITPIIAFSEDEEFLQTEENPLYALLTRDMAVRMSMVEAIQLKTGASSGSTPKQLESKSEWDELLSAATKTSAGADEKAGGGKQSLPDTRVKPLIASKWNQLKVGGKNVYNYYTPNHYYCGCVATAFSQVMRYHKYPTASLPSRDFWCEVGGVDRLLSTKSGTFDWNNMPLVPSSSISDAQCSAIGKLTYNVGVASKMSYTSSGSGAFIGDAAAGLTTYFGYASAVTLTSNGGLSGHIEKTLFASLDCGMPACIGIFEKAGGGHCVIADGYGYNGSTSYTHLNMGWGGLDDAWYNLPTVSTTAGYDFALYLQVVYNIMPKEKGEIVSGRVKDSKGKPVGGVTVKAEDSKGKQVASAKSSETGVYALIVPSAGSVSSRISYVVSAQSASGESASLNVSVGKSTTDQSDVGNRWGQDLVLAAVPSYAIQFKPNGGTGSMSDQVVGVGADVSLSANAFKRTDYRFAGWSLSSTASSPSYADREKVSFGASAGSKVALYAVWESTKIPLEVKFESPDAYGGSPGPQVYYVGKRYESLPQVWRTGYDFSGWYTDRGSKVTENSTVDASVTRLTARWTAHAYKVRFEANGGSGTMPDQSFTYDVGQNLSKCKFSRNGYAFMGWSTSAGGSVSGLIGDGSYQRNLCAGKNEVYVLYAVWSQNAPDLTVDSPVFLGAQGLAANGEAIVDATADQKIRLTVRNIGLGAAAASKAELRWSYRDNAAIYDPDGWERSGVQEFDVPPLSPGESAVLTHVIPAGTVVSWGTVTRFADEPLSFWANAVVNTGAFQLEEQGVGVADPWAAGGCFANNRSTSARASFYDPEKENWTFYLDGSIGIGERLEDTVEDIGRLSLPIMVIYRTNPRRSTEYKLVFVPDFTGECSVGFVPTDFVYNMTSGAVVLKRTDGQGTPKVVCEFGANEKYLKRQKMSFTKGETVTFTVDFNGVGLNVDACDPFECGFYFDPIAEGCYNPSGFETSNPASYEVAFDPGDGLAQQKRTYVVGVPYESFPSVPRDGYTLRGWYHVSDEGYCRKVTESREADSRIDRMVALWKPNGYQVNYDPNGGIRVKAGSERTGAVYGEDFTLDGGVCERRGYAFAGWATTKTGAARYADGEAVTDLTTVDGDTVDLYGAWEPISYKVRFVADDGSGATAEQTFRYDVEQNLLADPFVREGYSLKGWSRSKGGDVLFQNKAAVRNLSSIDGDVVTLHAIWEKCFYRIDFDPAGGDGSMTGLVVDYGREIVLPKCGFTSEGFSFAGWALARGGEVRYADGDTVRNLSGTLGETVVLYAVWEIRRGTIVFDANYGLGSMPEMRMLYDETVSLPRNTFVREGYEFLGWSLTRHGLMDFQDEDRVSGLFGNGRDAVTLFAVWRRLDGKDVQFPYAVDNAPEFKAANTYDGFLLDGVDVVGVVQVKTAKQVVKKGKVTISATATVTDANGKKWSYSKGVATVDGIVTGFKCTAKGCPVPSFGVLLGKNGLEGEWGEYAIFGSRRVKPETVYRGSRTLSFGNGDWMQLKVDSAGAVKIAGLGGGKSFSASARLVVGDRFAYVPVFLGANRILVRIADDGEVSVVSSSSGAMTVGDVTARPRFDGWEESANAMAGVAYFARPVMDGISWPLSFKASKLPTGCKINASTGVISGIPTKTGTFLTKVTATSKSNKKWTASCVVTNRIGALPEWARGQFTGAVDGNALTMTVGSTGKVSGKFKDGITNWTFSVSSFATNSVTVGETNLFCRATAKGTYKVKSGKKTVTKSVTAPISFTLVAAPDVSPIAAEGLGDFADRRENVEIRRVAGVRVSVGEAGGGTVKMDKSYGQVAAGGKVKLTAKANKKQAFAGWYDVMTGELISQATTYSLVSDGTTDRFLEARFIPESALTEADITLEWNAPTDIFVGVSYSTKPTVRGRAAVKIASVSGLPKGLSWKSGKVSGVPTTAKSYTVTVKVALTTNSKKVWSFKVPIAVKALPGWTVGTFVGGMAEGAVSNQVSVTVTAAGKVSGKLHDVSGAWTLSASSLAAYVPAADGEAFTAKVTGKNGKKSRMFEITVTGDGIAGFLTSGQEAATPFFSAWRNVWKTDLVDVAAELALREDLRVADDLVLRFGANGAVTGVLTVGKDTFTCTTTLVPEEDGYRTYLYFAPNTNKKFKGEVRVADGL